MQNIITIIKQINNSINGLVWGIPMLILLFGTGIYLSIRNNFVQIRHFNYAMKNTLGKIFKNAEAGKGELTPFQSLTTALAATVGTGNIAGISFAITLGGPGSIFWLWISAIIGMCTKYAEVVLSIKYRQRDGKGDWVGGPMYYIENGLGKRWKWLAVIFSIFGALAAFGIGNAVQIGNISSSVNNAISIFSPGFNSQNQVNLFVGFISSIIIALVLLGGIKCLGRVTEYLIPLMSIIYIVACLTVILANYEKLSFVFVMIFKGAFSPSSAVGGIGGFTIIQSLTWGVKRGFFSHEAGLGSAPIAHAASSETNPVKQGLFGIIEVFLDTIVICTLSGVTLLISGIDIKYGVEGTTALNAAALGTVMGDKVGSMIIAVGISLFALATILGWGLYGTRCCQYLFGDKSMKPYQIIYVLVVIVGATMDLSLAWEISDTLNGLMAIPNLIALIGISGVVTNLTREHFFNH